MFQKGKGAATRLGLCCTYVYFDESVVGPAKRVDVQRGYQQKLFL